MIRPNSHYGFPLVDTSIDTLHPGDLVSWYDDTLYLVLEVWLPGSTFMVDVRLLDLCEGEVVETTQHKEWVVGKVMT